MKSLLIKISFLLCIVYQPLFTFAKIAKGTSITGRVIKYDKKTVTISQYGNRKVTFLRSSLKKDFKKLKTGLLVTVVLSAEEVMSQIKKQSRKKDNQ